MTRARMIPLIATLSAVCLTASVSGHAQTLSVQEQAIVSAVDRQIEEAHQVLEQVVNIESATLNLDGVRRVGAVFEKEFNALAFSTRWVELPEDMERAGHLFAERQGDTGARALLIGHLDTVLEGDAYARQGGTVFGNGTADMKGGDVVLLFALRALQQVGALDERNIVVALMGDEESPGQPVDVSRAALIDAGRRSDFALGFESGDRATAVVARRGASTWSLEVSGRTGHASRIFGPEFGSRAILEAARILNEFREELADEEFLTFNPRIIAEGTEATVAGNDGTAVGPLNVISQTVLVEGDLRTISEEQKENARNRMRAILSEHLPQTDATIEFQDLYPAMAPTPENLELLDRVDAISRALGGPTVEAVDPSERGAADISFVAPFTPSLDGLGIDGANPHQPGESATLVEFSVPHQESSPAHLSINRVGKS